MLVATAADGKIAYANIVNHTTSLLQMDSLNQTVNVGNDNDTNINIYGDLSVFQKNTNITWTSATSFAINTWNSVAYGQNTFVAVSSSGTTNRVMVSDNGSTWFAGNTGVNNTNNWMSVAFGDTPQYGPMFVAVSSNGTNRAMMSGGVYATGGTGTVGTYWNASQTAPALFPWNSVCYGNNVFVAVGASGVSYSENAGYNWTSGTIPSTAWNTWTSVAYGNGTFVAVASNNTAGNPVMYSLNDGTTWTSASNVPVSTWQSVAYGNSLFVAVANAGTTRVMTSPDGITWIAGTAPSQSWTSVIYGEEDGLWVAVCSTGTGQRAMVSTDAITWTLVSTAGDNTWKSVTYGNGQYVAVANNNTSIVNGQVMYSSGIITNTVLNCDTTNNVVNASSLYLSNTWAGYAPMTASQNTKLEYGLYTGVENTGTITFSYTYTTPPAVTFGIIGTNQTTMSAVNLISVSTSSFSFRRMTQTGSTTAVGGGNFYWMAMGV